MFFLILIFSFFLFQDYQHSFSQKHVLGISTDTLSLDGRMEIDKAQKTNTQMITVAIAVIIFAYSLGMIWYLSKSSQHKKRLKK